MECTLTMKTQPSELQKVAMLRLQLELDRGNGTTALFPSHAFANLCKILQVFGVELSFNKGAG